MRGGWILTRASGGRKKGKKNRKRQCSTRSAFSVPRRRETAKNVVEFSAGLETPPSSQTAHGESKGEKIGRIASAGTYRSHH